MGNQTEGEAKEEGSFVHAPLPTNHAP